MIWAERAGWPNLPCPLVPHKPMSRKEYQCAREKGVTSVWFPLEKDEPTVVLLFICPGVPEVWASLPSRPGEEKRKKMGESGVGDGETL